MRLFATTRGIAPDRPLVIAFHGQWEDETAWPARLEGRGADVGWLFPRGPYRDAAERAGRRVEGWSWYEYTGDAQAFAASLAETGAWVLDLLDRTLADTGADPARVYLLGFSQGGYLAGALALTRPERFAGAALLGARFKTELIEGDVARLRHLRLFAGHGSRDRSVEPGPAARSVQVLRDAGLVVEHREYPCGHRVVPEMIDDALAYLLS